MAIVTVKRLVCDRKGCGTFLPVNMSDPMPADWITVRIMRHGESGGAETQTFQFCSQRCFKRWVEGLPDVT